MFAYHGKSLEFQGEFIMPLNELAKWYPEIAHNASKKYIGREKTGETLVYDPMTFRGTGIYLGTERIYWGDVSFFTLHNPQLLISYLKSTGQLHQHVQRSYFKIPIERFFTNSLIWKYDYNCDIEIDPANCIRVQSGCETINTSIIPAKTNEYYTRAIRENFRPLMYPFVPHLLTTNFIYISDCDVIEIV
jgi:hypothetical protein